jgi:hypothetical protein
MGRRWSRTRLLGLAATLLIVIVWQALMFRVPWPQTYEVRASSGLTEQDKFTYFLYYLNVFPVASTKNGLNYFFFMDNEPIQQQPNRLEYSRAAAQRLLREEPSTVVMEWGHTIRNGQLLLAYLYLPDAWRLGSPRDAEVRVTHGALFLLSLVAIVVMAWIVRRPLFGVVLVLLLGSSPFQMYEAYRHENIFSWPITAFGLLLALSMPLLFGRTMSRAYAVIVAVVAGVFAATAGQIRPEPIVLLGGVFLAIAAATTLSRVTRIVVLALLLAATATTTLAWNGYFDHKFEEATRVVGGAGGHVLTGGRERFHTFWHPMWCGLSDFDRTHGYAWSDAQALTFAQPILKAKYGIDLPWWWGVKGKEEHARTDEDYVDAAHLYYRIPFHVPHYDEVLRDKILGDIAADPMWYLGILRRRTWRILTEQVPVQLTVPWGALPIPFSGVLVLPLAAVAIRFRRWSELKVLLFSGAVSLPALLVYSGGSVTHYSVFHLTAIALTASVLFEARHRDPLGASSVAAAA